MLLRRSVIHIAQFIGMVLLLLVCESSRIWTAGQNHIAQYSAPPTDGMSAHDQLRSDSTNFIPLESTFQQNGKASYYANRFHGRRTASGESFDMDGFTAAHRKLPFGSIVRVTNPANNTVILVQINDRGPFVRSRVIDMARGAARCIDVSLHKVSIEGFESSEGDTSAFSIAFKGTSYDAYKVANNALVVSDTFECFSDAVRKHRILAAKSPEQDVFLVVTKLAADAAKTSGFRFAYYIATRKPQAERIDTASLLTE